MTQNIVYRFRPNGLDPDSALMDIMILRPYPKGEPKPAPAPTRYLDFDDPVADVTEIGETLGEIYDQDAANLPWVQKGLRASRAEVSFTHYMEARLRRHHQMLDKFIREGRAQ